MAGGIGERFWPLSTDEKPKQFLKLLGKETMIQMTVNRILQIIPEDRIFIATSEKYINLINEQLPNIPSGNIILEPVGKNTAPCIALSAFVINKIFKDTTMLVLPSDHIINNEVNFRDNILAAERFVNKNTDAIVTFGIMPDRAETEYGYIQCAGENKEIINDCEIKKVYKFVEKPNLEKARMYLNEGNYLWNGGMFIWKTDRVLQLTKEYLNSTYQILSEIAIASDENFHGELNEKYPLVQSISVDFGIMEKANSIYAIPCSFGWDDVGSWHALERYIEKDEKNNICVGDIKYIQGSNNIVVSSRKPIVVIGMDDVFVVESDNVIIVSKKDNIERIKEVKKYMIK
jgi:mannose-1-phosphate guanylyltransferase